MFLPGMKVPGGENTPFIPVRAFGAPHTICTGVAFAGIDHADAQTVGIGMLLGLDHVGDDEILERLGLVLDFSTSSPIIVSLSAIASRPASVSRCSFSQDRVNFMLWRSMLNPVSTTAASAG